MKTFALVEREDKRVVLEPMRELKESENLLDMITGKTWLDAVEKMKKTHAHTLVHQPGYGFYRE